MRLDSDRVDVEFGEINGISRGAAAEHDTHERREVAIGCRHAGEEQATYKFIVEDTAGNYLTQMETDLPAVNLDIEGTKGHAVVGPQKHFHDKRPHLGIACCDRKEYASLQQIVVVRDLEAAVVDGAIAGHEKLHPLAGTIRAELDVVGLEVLYERREGRAEVCGIIFVGHDDKYRST